MLENTGLFVKEKIINDFVCPAKQSQLPTKKFKLSSNLDIGTFIYPIADCTFKGKSSYNLFYPKNHFERPRDHTQLVNFKLNKGLKHSYSSTLCYGFNADISDHKTISMLSLDNTSGSKINLEQNKFHKIKPYSNKETMFRKTSIKNEIRHRSLMAGRLPFIKKKKFQSIIIENEYDKIEKDKNVQIEKCKTRTKKKYYKIIPRIKLIDKDTFDKRTKNEINKYDLTQLNNINSTNKSQLNLNKGFLRKKQSNIKMTSSYVRDLKMLSAFNKIHEPNLVTELKRKILGEYDDVLYK